LKQARSLAKSADLEVQEEFQDHIFTLESLIKLSQGIGKFVVAQLSLGNT
jgi:hypothetical protein